jgi:aldose 1-epimerase
VTVTLTVAEGPILVELLPEMGGRLHRLRVFGQDLLRTPQDPTAYLRQPFHWGGYVMAPWCNRIDAAPTAVGDEVVRAPVNSADGTALHGQVYGSPWEVRDEATLSVRGGGDGWPWPYESSLRVGIAGTVLTIEQSLTNLAESTMPAGLGLHPWFRRPVEVRINAPRVLPSNTDPDAEIEPVSGPYDLRTLRPMPDDLDATWLDPGDPAAELRWPTFGVRAVLRARSDAGRYIVAASPARRDAIALEPQTHAPQGLRRFLRGEPGALHPLEPDATLRLTIEMAFEQS